MQEMLLSGALDVALATREAMANERLRRHALYRERFAVVFAPGQRLARLEAVQLLDLRGENFGLPMHCELCEALLEACRKRGFDLDIIHRGERDDWVEQMVAAGRGVAVLPEYAHIGETTLARPLIEPVLAREAALVTVAGRPHAPWVHLLLRAARAHKWDEGEAAIDPRHALPPLVARPAELLAGVSR